MKFLDNKSCLTVKQSNEKPLLLAAMRFYTETNAMVTSCSCVVSRLN